MTVKLLEGQWYTTEELAKVLGIDGSTLRRWRTMAPPQGPPFVQISDRVTMYHAEDVEQWLDARRVNPSEATR
ncbi:hypothetical protein GCM10027174_25480 [Salinifilum aidingensis]